MRLEASSSSVITYLWVLNQREGYARQSRVLTLKFSERRIDQPYAYQHSPLFNVQRRSPHGCIDECAIYTARLKMLYLPTKTEASCHSVLKWLLPNPHTISTSSRTHHVDWFCSRYCLWRWSEGGNWSWCCCSYDFPGVSVSILSRNTGIRSQPW